MLESTQKHTSPGGGANIASSQYAKRTRDLIALITDIRAMGYDMIIYYFPHCSIVFAGPKQTSICRVLP